MAKRDKADAQRSDEQPEPKQVSRLSEGVDDTVWRFAKAERASLIIDAQCYFSVMQQAMMNARHRILLIGWDFDTRIHLTEGRRWFEKGRKREQPSRLGSFIPWLVRHRKTLEIRLLKWSFGIFKFPMRGSMWFDLLRWAPHKRIDFTFDSAHPTGCSHHQKIAVLDDRLAVCGGIDMTDGRWDTREHKEDDERRKSPRGGTYTPWHDATMMVEGEVADALEDIGRDRWIRAGGKALKPHEKRTDSLWPEELDVQFENVEIGIARTRAEYRDWNAVTEIEHLFLAHIRRAKRFIYAESQYFASRKIAEAMIARLEEDDPPEIVIVHPENADGWLEQQVMDHARAELVRCVREADHKNRFSIWCPYVGETPIYVHAKIMIVDDEVLRVGSANFNNRSMRLDSECDLFIDAARKGNEHAGTVIRDLRWSLLAEHCGVEEDEMPNLLARHGSMAAMIEHVETDSPRRLQRYHPPELNTVQKELARSQALDPEDPDDLLEPFAKGGIFRKGGRLSRMRKKLSRKNGE